MEIFLGRHVLRAFAGNLVRTPPVIFLGILEFFDGLEKARQGPEIDWSYDSKMYPKWSNAEVILEESR